MYVVTIDREDTYIGMSPTIEGTLALIDIKGRAPQADLFDETGRIAYLDYEDVEIGSGFKEILGVMFTVTFVRRASSWRKFGNREILYEFPLVEVDILK